MWLILTCAVAVVVAVAGVLGADLDAAMNRRKPRLGIILSGLLIPGLFTTGAIILGRHDPRTPDGPAYVMIGLLFLALISLPLSLASSALAVWIARSSRGGKGRNA